jgi:hypothetical protein
MQDQISENDTCGPTAVNQFILTGQYSGRFRPPDYSAVLAVFPAAVGFAGALFNNIGGEGYNWPQGWNVTQYPIIDDVSKTLGPHTPKFGAKFHRVDLSYLSYQTYLHGRITERNLLDFYRTANNLQQRFPQVTETPWPFTTSA